MVYSADTFNDRDGIMKFYEDGAMSEGRRDQLLNFPYHHDLVLHESGVPPIHTPLSTFADLPQETKDRIYIVHKPTSQLPPDAGLKSALVGPENTIVIGETKGESFDSLEIIDLVCSNDIFKEFAVSRSGEFINAAVRRCYAPGEVLVKECTMGDNIYTIAMGVVHVSVDGLGVLKCFTVGDHFGEMSIVTGKPRTATITAVTPVETFEISKSEFLHIVRGTNAIARLQHLGEMQQQKSWVLMEENKALRRLTSSQKTKLQSLFVRKVYRTGDRLWTQGREANCLLLIESGSYVYSRARTASPFQRGTMIGEIPALLCDQHNTTTLECSDAGSVFIIYKRELLKFFDSNPGFQLVFINKKFVE
jgi:CRP-like cAMP-binding protein